jgi:hypothetical protein
MRILLATVLVTMFASLSAVEVVQAGFLFDRDKKEQLVTQSVTNGGNQSQNGSTNSVPIPATLGLMGAGLLGLGIWQLMRR